MDIIVSTASMIPLYEQIVEQVKNGIKKGALKEGDALPSVRTLAKDLRISALTVKKAYDTLEEDGFVITVHGKGTYIAAVSSAFLQEEQRKEIESELDSAIQKARRCGISDSDIRSLFDLLMGV